MVWVDEGAHFEHLEVIRCDIKQVLAEKCKVENEPTSEKKQRVKPLVFDFWTSPYFVCG